MDQVEYGSLPFEEQIKFFLSKFNLPTERWDSIVKEAHDQAFVVAGAMKADLLNDLRTAVTKGIQDGTTLEQFRKEFDAIVATHGWTGWTGEGTPEGVAWRTQVIYETNLYTSYAAGRYEQMKAVAKDRPFWRYRHNDNVAHPRPLHLAWDGLILAHDDPWWESHYPPGGYGCKCYVQTLAPRDLKKLGKTGPDQAPNNGTYDWLNPDGSVREAGIPNGIDRGWNYAPGANADTPLRQLIERKLFNLDAPIGAKMWKTLQPFVEQNMKNNYLDWLDKIRSSAPGERVESQYAIIGAIDPDDIAALPDLGINPKSAEIGIGYSVIKGPKAKRHASPKTDGDVSIPGDAIPDQVWENLPDLIKHPLAVLVDNQSKKLVYILPEASSRRPQLSVEIDVDIGRKKTRINMIVSGYRSLIDKIISRVDRGEMALIRGELQ